MEQMFIAWIQVTYLLAGEEKRRQMEAVDDESSQPLLTEQRRLLGR